GRTSQRGCRRGGGGTAGSGTSEAWCSWCSPLTALRVSTKIVPLRFGPIRKRQPSPPSSLYGSSSTAGSPRSCPQSSLPSVTAAGGTEDHRHPSRQDRQPRPVRHRRLLVTTLILRSCAPAVSSLSVLLDPRRSAGGEPPWPDPQRWRGGPGGYLASGPVR